MFAARAKRGTLADRPDGRQAASRQEGLTGRKRRHGPEKKRRPPGGDRRADWIASGRTDQGSTLLTVTSSMYQPR